MEASLILFTSDVHNYCCITIYVSDNDIEFIILMYVSSHVCIWIKPMVNFLTSCSGEY